MGNFGNTKRLAASLGVLAVVSSSCGGEPAATAKVDGNSLVIEVDLGAKNIFSSKPATFDFICRPDGVGIFAEHDDESDISVSDSFPHPLCRNGVPLIPKITILSTSQTPGGGVIPGVCVDQELILLDRPGGNAVPTIAPNVVCQ